MKKITDINLENKTVIIRVDYNIPIKNGEIIDDTRIKESLKTINYAISQNAKIVLMSHLKRVKTSEDLQYTLKPVAKRLQQLLNKEVIFINQTRGELLEQTVKNLKNQDILLMENTRFEDLNDRAESNNNEQLGKYWALLGDVFINDAFGTAHRKHASNIGIAKHLENGIGFLIEKELKHLDIKEEGTVIILGGAKVSDKISLIQNLVLKSDHILIGGAMANTFLKALDYEMGQSLVDDESLEFCKKMLSQYKNKIILPIDLVDQDKQTKKLNELEENSVVYDIGKDTIKYFYNYLKEAKTIIWNGPVGMFEDERFKVGTMGICEILKNLDSNKIAGGGDTASAVKNLGYEEVFTHISTGGGASLTLLEGKKLVGLGE